MSSQVTYQKCYKNGIVRYTLFGLIINGNIFFFFSSVHDFTEETKGIPEFWLTIFKNVDLLSEMVQDYDEPILEKLTDVKLKFHDEPMGFTLEFYFAENEYFTNKVLTKYYEMKCQPDKNDPFSFEGPEIIKCKVS